MGVYADAVCIGVGYTAATVRLVCRITCKITFKIDLYTVHHRNNIFADPSLRYTKTVHATDYILSPVEIYFAKRDIQTENRTLLWRKQDIGFDRLCGRARGYRYIKKHKYIAGYRNANSLYRS